MACRADFAHFLDKHVYFLCKNQGHRKWESWPIHETLIDAINESDRLIILKARQLGISWAVAAYALWTAMFHSGQNVLLLSQGQNEAEELLAKCRYMHTHTADWLKPELTKDNQTELVFGRLDSNISALPATEKAGRSEGTNLVVCDEWAFHPYAETNWAAIQPTLGERAKFIGISTANGRGQFFHQTWQAARASANNFKALFFSCWAAPERTQEWYEKQQKEYISTPHLFPQEHPRTEVEAFISSGNCYFDIAAIQGMLDLCREPNSSAENGALKIWQKPVIGRKYVIGADVAEGRDAGNDKLDYSGAAVLDWQTGLHVADLHGQWPLDVFASLADALGRQYNNALLGVERNNHGHAVLLALKGLGYPNLYYHEDVLDQMDNRRPAKVTKTLGWPTTAKTKPILESEFAAAITSQSVCSFDKLLWDECLSYVRHGDGKNGAQSGTHDDRVVKAMIAWQMRKYVRPAGSGGIVVGSVRVGR